MIGKIIFHFFPPFSPSLLPPFLLHMKLLFSLFFSPLLSSISDPAIFFLILQMMFSFLLFQPINPVFLVHWLGWPLKQPEIKNWGSKCKLWPIITCSRIPQSSKRRSHEWPPKAARNPKLGIIFAKCAPMTPCPLLVQPLGLGTSIYSIKVICFLTNYYILFFMCYNASFLH